MSTTRLNVVLALVLVVALALPHFSTARSDILNRIRGQRPTAQPSAQHYCGRRVVEALNSICYSAPWLLRSRREMALDDSYPFRSRSSANTMMERFGGSRFRRQLTSSNIHDECCVKTCTVEYLRSYCTYWTLGE